MERDRFAVEEPPLSFCSGVCVVLLLVFLVVAGLGAKSAAGAGALGGALAIAGAAWLLTVIPALICAIAAFVRKERLAWITIPVMLVFAYTVFGHR
jgi:hypothetical protein